MLSFKDLEIIHALISSRLDYYNDLYMGLSQYSLYRLQLVQMQLWGWWLAVGGGKRIPSPSITSLVHHFNAIHWCSIESILLFYYLFLKH